MAPLVLEAKGKHSNYDDDDRCRIEYDPVASHIILTTVAGDEYWLKWTNGTLAVIWWAADGNVRGYFNNAQVFFCKDNRLGINSRDSSYRHPWPFYSEPVSNYRYA